jgi:hypothetical protein
MLIIENQIKKDKLMLNLWYNKNTKNIKVLKNYIFNVTNKKIKNIFSFHPLDLRSIPMLQL